MGRRWNQAPTTRQIAVRLDAGVYEVLRAAAERRGVSVASVIRGALAQVAA